MEGRFISKDPIGFEGGDWNVYGYAFNNPGLYTDPSGLASAGQLGIGNPGSYGGEDTCESMYDEDFPFDPFHPYAYIPPARYGEVSPFGGLGAARSGLARLLGRGYPVKPGYMGRMQPYNPATGRYLPFSANPGPAYSPVGRALSGAGQAWGEATTGAPATPVGRAGNAGYLITKFIINLFN